MRRVSRAGIPPWVARQRLFDAKASSLTSRGRIAKRTHAGFGRGVHEPRALSSLPPGTVIVARSTRVEHAMVPRFPILAGGTRGFERAAPRRPSLNDPAFKRPTLRTPTSNARDFERPGNRFGVTGDLLPSWNAAARRTEVTPDTVRSGHARARAGRGRASKVAMGQRSRPSCSAFASPQVSWKKHRGAGAPSSRPRELPSSIRVSFRNTRQASVARALLGRCSGVAGGSARCSDRLSWQIGSGNRNASSASNDACRSLVTAQRGFYTQKS